MTALTFMNLEFMQKMLKKYFIYFLTPTLIFISGCLEPIELDIPKGFRESVIIEGKIVKGLNTSTFELKVSQLFSFTAESRGRINARDAIIVDDEGNQMSIKATGQGIYFYTFTSADPIKIESGRSYQIKIGTFDGREFESTFEPLVQGPEIKNLGFEKVEKEVIFPDQSIRRDTFIRYNLDTDVKRSNATDKNYLRWELQRSYQVTDFPIDGNSDPKICYVTNRVDVANVRIFNGPAQAAEELDNFPLLDERLNRPEFAEGLYFTAIQESLSKPAFEYWRSVQEVSNREGDIFAAPPGKVKSNFVNINDPEDETFGYFYVTTHDTARVFISPDFAGNPANRCPSEDLINPDGSCGDQLCCDCTTEENSTTVRPHYWGS